MEIHGRKPNMPSKAIQQIHPLNIVNKQRRDTEISVPATEVLSYHATIKPIIDVDVPVTEFNESINETPEEDNNIEKAVRNSLKKGKGKSLKIFLQVLFLVTCIGNASSPTEEIRKIFETIELVCQFLFLILLLLKVWSFEPEKKYEGFYEILYIGTGLAGILIENYAIARYFLIFRVFRLHLFLEEIPQLQSEF